MGIVQRRVAAEYFHLYFAAFLPGSKIAAGCLRQRGVGSAVCQTLPSGGPTHGEQTRNILSGRHPAIRRLFDAATRRRYLELAVSRRHSSQFYVEKSARGVQRHRHLRCDADSDRTTWSPIDITTCSKTGAADPAYFVDNYTYSSYGQDEILLPINLDLTQIEHPVLRFRVAYAPYYDGNFFIDSLKVLVSDDCGASFTTLFRSGGEALSTTTSGNGPNNLYEYELFSPQSCDEWREIALNLDAYAGKFVTVKFLNQSGYGNNMYLDDIIFQEEFMIGTTSPGAEIRFRIQPNPAISTAFAQGHSAQNELLQLNLFNAAGQSVWRQEYNVAAGNWDLPISLAAQPQGVYWLSITSETGHKWTEKVVKH